MMRVGGWGEPFTDYFSRELSWLAFNARVLSLVRDPDVPLLERARYLSIFSANLDEFFQVRVSGLADRVAAELTERSLDGHTAAEQLHEIRLVTSELCCEQQRLFLEQVQPALAAEGIHLLSADDLDEPRAGSAPQALLRTRLPGAHPARRGPRPPLPVHLRPVAELGRAHARPGRLRAPLRPGEGPQHPRPVGYGQRGGEPVHRPRGCDRGPSRHAVPGHGAAGAPRLPRHPQRRPHPQRRGCRGPAHSGGDGAAAPPLPVGGPPRGGRLHVGGGARAAAARARPARRRGRPHPGPRRPERTERDSRPAPAQAEMALLARHHRAGTV